MKNILCSLKIISWKNLHTVEHFSYSFVMEHYVRLPLILNPHFNSSMSCKLLVLSIKLQHHLKIDNLVETIPITVH